MKIKSQKDFYSGLMFALVGVAFAIGSTHYTVGDPARMGPGYFPLILGILLAALGCGILAESLLIETPDGDRIGAWAWKPLGFIIAANCVFGVLLGGLPSLGIPAMGLVVAIFALTFLASLAGEEFKAKEVAVLAAVLAAGSYVAFIWLLRLQMQVWPSFLSA
ncbi:tripartite tricarboxylate transporter TctB family protein [Ramlibacter monticola]|uniref:Tripartite tricarboxylate transporter TctB family protein n=1 Tax=Ramlibacter monticola TaxID=1926872 RepID=A0A936Z314_9BURK|nr:tripartite tricarboxylate transporter TctB family protein [Ramlibacter monticola]MBL0392647.1 tripartite tricarboxylate transporter TctB family protein [Ramlibacter monticola]